MRYSWRELSANELNALHEYTVKHKVKRKPERSLIQSLLDATRQKLFMKVNLFVLERDMRRPLSEPSLSTKRFKTLQRSSASHLGPQDTPNVAVLLDSYYLTAPLGGWNPVTLRQPCTSNWGGYFLNFPKTTAFIVVAALSTQKRVTLWSKILVLWYPQGSPVG
jgi:hypothetical protein